MDVDGGAPPPPQVPLMKHAAWHDGLSPQFAPLENCCSCRPAVADPGTCQSRPSACVGVITKHASHCQPGRP